MRRLDRESGAVAVIVAILAVVLFSLGALVIDVGALYAERRQLQNGADAAALAIAAECLRGECPSDATALAQPYADGNSHDAESRVDVACGAPDLPSCAGLFVGPLKAKIDALDSGQVSYVAVRTATLRNGSADMPPLLAGITGGDGSPVAAASIVAYGAAGSASSDFPLSLDICEWAAYTSTGEDLAPPPPYSSSDLADIRSHYEHVFFYKQSPVHESDVVACAADPAYKDAPGAFGWVTEEDPDDECAASTETGLLYEKEGASIPADCERSYLSAIIDTTVFLPIFSTAVKDGGTVEYAIAGYAAFYVTGFRLSGSFALPSGDEPCSNAEGRCIRGFFTSQVMPRGRVTSGESMGAGVMQFVS